MKNIQAGFKEESGEIVKEEGSIKIRLNCKSLFLFPKKCQIVGKITAIYPERIVPSVLSYYEGSISKKDISKEILHFVLGKWKFIKNEKELQVDDLIQFEITGFNQSFDRLMFSGVMKDPELHGLYEHIDLQNRVEEDEINKIEDLLENIFNS